MTQLKFVAKIYLDYFAESVVMECILIYLQAVVVFLLAYIKLD